MLGPYIKSRGISGTKMSANAALITMETYVQQGETNSFSYIFRGPEGVFNNQTGPILLSSYPLTCIYVHVQ